MDSYFIKYNAFQWKKSLKVGTNFTVTFVIMHFFKETNTNDIGEFLKMSGFNIGPCF